MSTMATPSSCRSASRCRTSWRVDTSTPLVGLVHEQQLRLTQERAREEHALLLPTRELADVPLGQPADAQAIEDGVHVGLLRAARPRKAAVRGCAT